MNRLELLIELDSKGAVQGVKSLNTEIDKLDKGGTQATKSGSSLWKEVSKGALAAGAAAFSVKALVSGIESSITEAIEAEQVQSKLNSTLQAEGEDVKTVGALVDDFATQMQGLTGESDEAIKSLATLSYNLGISGDKMQDAVRGAIGLTTLYGGSMQSALEAVARAYQGNWRQIDMMIPEVKALTNESDKLALLQKKMAEGFQATTDAMKTNAGQLKAIKNDWDNFKESVGTALLTLFSGLTKVSKAFYDHDFAYRKLKERHDQEIANLEVEAAQRKKYTDIVLNETVAVDGLNAVQEGTYIGMLQMVGILPKLTAEKEKGISATEKYKQQLERMNAAMLSVNSGIIARHDTQIELDHAIGLGIENQDKYNNIQYDFQGIVADSGRKVEKWTIDWENANEVMQFARGLLSEISQGLEALGVDLGRNGEAWLGAAEGAATFTQGLITHNPLTIISGAVTMLSGAIQALAGDGIGEAIKRENEWMALNEDLEEQLRDLAKEVGTVHEATSIMLDDIIESTDITIENFDQYAQRIQQILSNLDRGELSLAETTHEIGEAFDALIDKAEDLGTEGSKSLIDLFGDLKNRGIEVAEINEYIAEKLGLAADAYADLLDIMEDNKDAAEVWGDLNVGVLNDILAYRKKVAANQDLENSIDAATKALYNLSAAQKLSEEQFDSFGEGAAEAYAKLIGKGYKGDEALRSMKEMLQRLQYLKEQFGYSLDPELQKLLDQAIKKGIVIENAETEMDLFKKQVDYQEHMAKALETDIPGLLKDIASAIKDITPTPAATGYRGWAQHNQMFIASEREPEYVSITPASRMGSDTGSRASTTNIGVTINGSIDPYVVAEAMLKAWRGNYRGVRSVLGGH